MRVIRETVDRCMAGFLLDKSMENFANATGGVVKKPFTNSDRHASREGWHSLSVSLFHGESTAPECSGGGKLRLHSRGSDPRW
jgi:hypothetical protein